jgi:hypothetical protein
MSVGMIAFWGGVLALILEFVRGEIDADQYQERVQVLRHGPTDRAT